MSENPFAPPQSAEEDRKVSSVDKVRRVAGMVGAASICLALQISCFATIAVAYAFLEPDTGLAGAIVGILAAPLVTVGFTSLVFGAIIAGLLAADLYHPVVGILLGLVALYPGIGSLLLLLVRWKAGMFLNHQGIEVGWFGTRPDQFLKRIAELEAENSAGV